ncbi:hypothetical protein LVJ94_34740 [Pendulispora rubella]|uniref:Uncharacterized protein n=1 Tax=Pendulispora rubella TaxID=2741070 RepID=A0ABZ2KTU7_9BACT
MLARPNDTFARDPRGRPLRVNSDKATLRIVGFAEQRELAPPEASSPLYWLLSQYSAADGIDFELLRGCLERDGLVGMGVVAQSSPGRGAVLLVPTSSGFALHPVARTHPTAPFETLFSQRPLTMIVDGWSERIAPAHARAERRRPRVHATALWGLDGTRS